MTASPMVVIGFAVPRRPVSQSRWLRRTVLRSIFAATLVLATATRGHAVEWGEEVAEPAWDWRPGDLIVRNGVNPFDDALARAMGWPFASVGILRSSSAGPRVVFADEVQGVTEVTLDGFVAELSAEDYDVYRAPDFAGSAEGEQMVQGPIAKYALLTAYGAPFDAQLAFGNGKFYNAELPFEAALGAGVVLGETVRLGTLAEGKPELRDLFLSRLREHPYCAVVMGDEECWKEIADVSIATVQTILQSGLLTRVHPR